MSTTNNHKIPGDLDIVGALKKNGVTIDTDDIVFSNTNTISIGSLAGESNQGTHTIAIGVEAGQTNQGFAAIAVGRRAGETNQGANSIILNATGVALDSTTASSFHVKPVRGGNFAASALAYTADGEIVEETNMHFDTTGRVGIGETNPQAKLHIKPGSDGAFMIGELTATQATAPMVMRDSGSEQIHFYYGTTKVGSITSTGTGTVFNTSSDYRLKENIMELTYALDRVNEISVYQFNFISEPTRKVNGFIAHELQSIIPEAVTGVKDEMIEFGVVTRTSDGTVIQKDVKEPEILDEGTEWSVTSSKPNYQGVDQSKLVPLLTRSIQELSIKNDTLETQLTSVLARLDALENA